MIEEVPWLWALNAKSFLCDSPLLVDDVQIKLKPRGAERPSF